MNELRLKKPILILVVGIPGSGRTTFASEFAKNFGMICLDYNTIADHLQSVTSSENIYPTTMKIMTELYQNIKDFHSQVVIDAPVNLIKDRVEISRIARDARIPYLTVWVQTDELTAKSRAIRNAKLRGKSSVVHGEFEKPNPLKENFITISGKHSFNTQSMSVLKKIASMLKKI